MIKFVKNIRGGTCKFCCYQNGDLICKKPVKRSCRGGYYVRIQSDRPRKGRDRRLLESLLKCLTVYVWPQNMESKLYSTSGHDRIYGLSKDNEQQLIAIKEAILKGGGK